MSDPQDPTAPAAQDEDDLAPRELSSEELDEVAGGSNPGCTVNGNCPCQS